MNRRAFITLLGGAGAWPIMARGQQLGRPARIGFFSADPPSARPQLVTAFVERLQELGWTEGRTVSIEYRWVAGDNKRLADIVAEFIRLEVDVMVMEGTAATLAAKQATSSIPIVFPVAGDPVDRTRCQAS
jgi:putative tryptophan/tyrosine transport system substrate-binding protein